MLFMVLFFDSHEFLFFHLGLLLWLGKLDDSTADFCGFVALND